MRTIILDLETCPIDSAAEFIPLPDAPGNYKNPDAIEKYQREKHAELVERAALDLDLARVACIGYQDAEESEVIVKSFKTEGEERAGLSWLQAMLADAKTVTFNGLKYDLPLLQRRAAYLGLPPWKMNLDRYRTPHLDLWNVLSHNGAVSAHSLAWYIKRLGWTDLAGTIDGADVPAAIAAGEWAKVEAHCRADIIATYRLAMFLGVEL